MAADKSGSFLSEKGIAELLRRHIKKQGQKIHYTQNELDFVIRKARILILDDPSLIEVNGSAYVFGDIYGNFACLSRLMSIAGFPPKKRWIFLGNYADRGEFGLECLVLVLLLKIHYPDRVFLLRGNHECQSIGRLYGLWGEITTRRMSEGIFNDFCELFDHLPFAVLLNRKVFCCHGGLSASMMETNGLDKIRQIIRPINVPKDGLITDLLWACPSDKLGFVKDEGSDFSISFGPDMIEKFCKTNGIELIIRGFQIVQDGFMFYPNKHVLTIFSCANFDSNFDNSSVIVHLDLNLKLTIKRYKILPTEKMSTGGMVTTGGRSSSAHITTTTNESGHWTDVDD